MEIGSVVESFGSCCGTGLFAVMSAFLKYLQKPEFVHVLLNHLPLTGLFGALLALVGALVARDRRALFIALALVMLFSLSAWPVSEYGEEAYDRVLAMSDHDGAAYLARHRQLAERWLFTFYVTAGAAAVAMVVGVKRPRFFCVAASAAALLAASSLVAGAVIADCGGKIRHREFRIGPAPMEPGGGQGRLSPEPYKPVMLQTGFGQVVERPTEWR